MRPQAGTGANQSVRPRVVVDARGWSRVKATAGNGADSLALDLGSQSTKEVNS